MGEGISSLDELYQSEAGTQMAGFVTEQLQLDAPPAKQLFEKNNVSYLRADMKQIARHR